MKSCKKRTQTLFQTLQNSGDVEKQFEKLIDECKISKTKYKDPDFYPQKNLTEEDGQELNEHEWRRIEDQYPNNLFENISPESVIQGKLGDCYLVIGLIYASHDTNLVKSLFHPKSSLQYGIVLVYFYFLGERIPVIIDTQVAYENSSAQHPLFCHPRTNKDSCWFVLVEKAFAKACGGYSSITEGQTSFGIHILFDYFSTNFSPIEEIIPAMSLEDEKKIIFDANEKVFQILQKLKKKNTVIGTYVPEDDCEYYDESIGLIKKHAYYVLDVRESEGKKFIKLRNPWGIGKYNGDYSNGSNKWTEQLKKDLDYSEDDDGSFWMLLENYFYYFKAISYSLQKEKNWKEKSVYGKIDGYLDGRSPCSQSPHVGCIPQWSIKFSRKTIVRLTFAVAGPESYHGIYICKNHGRKVDSLDIKTEIMRSNTNSFVNGIEYKVEDFSEPFTFFLTRTNAMNEPCYFRILIQSEDKKFKVKKFDDDFINEKWNSVIDTRVFSNPEIEQWYPFQDTRPLSTCRQYYVTFNSVRNKDEIELRFRVFKNFSEGPLYLLLARTHKKISYSFTELRKWNFEICSNSNYEEFSVPLINKKSKKKSSFHFVFSFYRNKQDDVNEFKFQVLSKGKFEFGMLPEPDPTNNCCYRINEKLLPNENDGLLPTKNSVEPLKQWCLMFKTSPTTLFIDYSNENTSSNHYIFLETKETPGQKISLLNEDNDHYEFEIRKNCVRDQITWQIEDISIPYALCVTRDSSISTSEYTLNIYGTEDFDMFEIEGNNLSNKMEKIVYDETQPNENKNIDFPEVEFFEQPINFTPIKNGYYDSKRKYFLTSIRDHPQQQRDENDSSEFDLKQDPNAKGKNKKKKKHNDENQNFNFETTDDYYSVSNAKNDSVNDMFNIDEDKHIRKILFFTKEKYGSKKLISQSKFYLYKRKIIFTVLESISLLNINSSKNRVLVISYFNLLILKQKRNSKKITKEFNECLLDLHSISLLPDKVVKLKFQNSQDPKGTKIIFKAKNVYSILSSINDHLKRILTSAEIRNIKYKNTFSPKSIYKCTSHSILFRLITVLPIKKILFQDDLIKTISHFLFSHSDCVYFSKIPTLKKVFPIFVSCILIDPFIKQINISDPKAVFPFMFQNINYFGNISHLKIKGPDSDYLQKFVETIKNINSISFYDYHIKSFKYLNSLMEENYVYSVGFDSSLDENTYNSFVAIESFKKLVYFRVSDLKNIPLYSTAHYFKNLIYLSLASCYLHIGKALEIIASNQLTKLEKLDLSGNFGFGFERTKEIVFPNQLNSLYVDYVEWEAEQLIIFFGIISKSNLSLLSISRISFFNNINLKSKSKKGVANDVDEFNYHCWNNFFNTLPSQMNSISYLNWDSNRVNEPFENFLTNSTKLTDISMCYCNCDDIEFIKDLLIESNIEKVNIQNIFYDDKESYLKDIKDFLASIPQMKSLKQIDFSHNSFDRECFQILAKSLIESNVEYFAVDDSELTSYRYFLKFYRKLVKFKNKPIIVSYPFLDIERLKISQSDVIELNKYFHQTKKYLLERQINSFEVIQEVSFLRLDRPFPQYYENKIFVKEARYKFRKKVSFSNLEINENPSIDIPCETETDESNNAVELEEEEEDIEEANNSESQSASYLAEEDEEELNDEEENEAEIEEEEEEFEEEKTKKSKIEMSNPSYYYYINETKRPKGIKHIIYVNKNTIINRMKVNNVQNNFNNLVETNFFDNEDKLQNVYD